MDKVSITYWTMSQIFNLISFSKRKLIWKKTFNWYFLQCRGYRLLFASLNRAGEQPGQTVDQWRWDVAWDVTWGRAQGSRRRWPEIAGLGGSVRSLSVTSVVTCYCSVALRMPWTCARWNFCLWKSESRWNEATIHFLLLCLTCL